MDRKLWIQNLVIAPLRVLFLTALGLGLGMGAYWLAAHLRTSPALAVRRIEAQGLQRASLRDLLQLAGLREGMNVFSIDVNRAGRLMEEHPWVLRAQVRRVVPDRIMVDIEEHQPAAMLSLGALYLMDGGGRIFKRLQPGENFDLPVVTGVDREAYGKQLEQVQRRVREALSLAGQIESTSCLEGRRVSEVHLDELMGPSLVLDPGAVRVRMGSKGAVARLPLLCRVFDEMKQRKLAVRTIMLDLASRPTWATVVPEVRGVDVGVEL